MNEPILPRAKGRYLVWIDSDETETEGRAHEYRHWRATPKQAALDHADWMVEHGGFPDYLGKPFVLLVRDLADGSLTRFRMGWEYNPEAYVQNTEPVEPDVEAAHA